jgi:hypothetical protein
MRIDNMLSCNLYLRNLKPLADFAIFSTEA